MESLPGILDSIVVGQNRDIDERVILIVRITCPLQIGPRCVNAFQESRTDCKPRPCCFRSLERFPLIVWWKCADVEGRLSRFLRAEDVPPEQFAPLAVRQSAIRDQLACSDAPRKAADSLCAPKYRAPRGTLIDDEYI